MASVVERGIVVPYVTTTFFPYSETPTTRIGHEESLDSQVVRENLAPNTIAEVDILGNPWSVVAVLSPYTRGFHVMLVDLSDRYLPDPTKLSDSDREGDALMDLWGRIVDFQNGLPDSRSVHVGYNWSPRSFGEEEEKGGFQTLTTKWHPQFWNFGELNNFVPLENVGEGARRAILGNKYNQWFGEVLRDYLKNQRFGFLDASSMRVDKRGLEVALTTNLSRVFQGGEFFSNGLKPIAVFLDKLACNISQAFSSVDFSKIDTQIEAAFETRTNGILPFLREDPHVLSPEERRARIQQLEDKGYDPRFVRKLLLLNSWLEERQDTDPASWFRKGFGYALVFSQNLKTGQALLRVMPNILVAERGGVVEALGVALKRTQKTDETSWAEINAKRLVCKQLREYLMTDPSLLISA